MLEGIQEALVQYKRVSHNYRPTGPNATTFPSQIELTLVTSRSPSSLRAFVERVADRLELENLKKISAVCVSDAQWMVGCGHPGRLMHVSGDCVRGVRSDEVMGECDSMSGEFESQFTSSPSELGKFQTKAHKQSLSLSLSLSLCVCVCVSTSYIDNA